MSQNSTSMTQQTQPTFFISKNTLLSFIYLTKPNNNSLQNSFYLNYVLSVCAFFSESHIFYSMLSSVFRRTFSSSLSFKQICFFGSSVNFIRISLFEENKEKHNSIIEKHLVNKFRNKQNWQVPHNVRLTSPLNRERNIDLASFNMNVLSSFYTFLQLLPRIEPFCIYQHFQFFFFYLLVHKFSLSTQTIVLTSFFQCFKSSR